MAQKEHYSNNTWETGNVITADKMNNIENQLKTISDEVTNAVNGNIYNPSNNDTLSRKLDGMVKYFNTNTEPSSSDLEYTRLYVQPTDDNVDNIIVPTEDQYLTFKDNFVTAFTNQNYAAGAYVEYNDEIYKVISAISKNNSAADDAAAWAAIIALNPSPVRKVNVMQELDNLINVYSSDNQLTQEQNRIWINNTSSGVQVPTYEEFSDLKSAITEQTYNLVIGSMDGMTINQSGRMIAETGTMLFYAPVTANNYYTVLTNEDSLVCGFIAETPTPGAYTTGRVIQTSKTIQATINGYLVCRAVTPYTQYQIINGQINKPYLSPLSAVDAVARQATEDAYNITRQITENTYNIISGTMTGMTINSNGRMIADSGYYLFYAPVANGTNYTVKTNDSSLVCGFTTSIPAARNYLNARIVQSSKTIEATVDGYLVCRAIAGYETPQIVEGSMDLAYQPIGYSAVDVVARYNAQLLAKWGAKTGCFFGDSLTQQGYYTSALSGLYNITVNNYAVSGARYVGTGISDTSMIGNQIDGASSDCDFVFILGGTNDWGLGKTLGTADTFTDNNYSTLYNAVYNTLGLLRTKYPTKPIFVATIPQRNWQSTGQASGIMDNGNGVSVMQFNDAIKYVAGLYGCIVIDSFTSGICIGNLDTYTSDNLHFNPVGGSRYATHIMDKMQTITPY